jgi:NAD(P)-dependent dehydrogenase (short-subunit alcohol dehydrogenase family)
MEKFLEGKVALITGAGSGFGREIAIEYASEGADLVLNDINLESIEETRDIILRKYDREILLFQADISNAEKVKEISKEAYKKFDNIFVLVNNAGINGGLYKSLVCPIENYDNVMGVNLKGSWLMVKNFYRKMKIQKFRPIAGKIINIASCAGIEPNPTIGIYSISKAALIFATKLWALELAPRVTVNSISPGVHVTGAYDNDPELAQKLLDMRNVKIPLDRLGTKSDVANLCLFLASPASDFITGENIVVDGGMTISINRL